ncbi:ABC-type nitrate/sulfonate/bicarbonate transport system, ATPase component [Natronincola peptidivorans]|uniref:ABC-type nitrate/sulfonate/bicarbonate transport system, ATPase component n=1 Tax=Natronincola peptidivorans TaxID=426128 RepID=A0A1I0A768_9FIRM|nr:ABC transporter ATP-binding protein [Natronincola peptidivorans]SES89967.1 ABC-type nitrate/sulfonate/bicarbonate transport system, ATPase component [Natronincola peptidivorans]
MKKLEIIEVTKYFDALYTLENISLSLEKNQFISILGPSGSGKSTLFNIIAGIEKADHGKILIEGRDYTGKPGRVSYMHQKDLLLPWKTILENVSMPLIIKGTEKKDAKKQAEPYFHLFGLEGFENHYPHQLSGGMRQRAALLRTYLFSQDIMLLDEPFGGLDAITKRKMQQWLLSVLEDLKASILFITHDIDEAIFLSDRIYILSERPAKIKEIVDVTIPRPRDHTTFTCEAFVRLKEKILAIL